MYIVTLRFTVLLLWVSMIVFSACMGVLMNCITNMSRGVSAPSRVVTSQPQRKEQLLFKFAVADTTAFTVWLYKFCCPILPVQMCSTQYVISHRSMPIFTIFSRYVGVVCSAGPALRA